jgi:hypothetical protein
MVYSVGEKDEQEGREESNSWVTAKTGYKKIDMVYSVRGKATAKIGYILVPWFTV